MDPVLLCAFCLLGLTLLNYLVCRDLLYPATAQSGIWLLIVVSYALRSDTLLPLSTLTTVVVFGFAALFSFGTYVGSLGKAGDWDRLRARPPSRGDRTFVFGALAIAAIGLPFFALKAWEYSTNDFSDNPLINIRYSLTGEGQSYGLLAYLVPISVLATALSTYFARSIGTRYAVVAGSISLAYSILWTGRTFLFLLAIIVLATMVMQKRISVRAAIFTFVAVGVLLFGALGLLLGKGGSLYEDTLENVGTMATSFSEYALTPLAAFDYFAKLDSPLTLGSEIFRTFVAIVAAMGIESVAPVALVKEFVLVPTPINVYTVFHPYYADFGLAGTLAAAAFLGFVHGFLYRKALIGSPVWTTGFALSLFPLFMQFFQDQYFSLTSTWIQYLVLLGLYSVIRTRRERSVSTAINSHAVARS